MIHRLCHDGVMRTRHYRGHDGVQILPDGRRPIRWVIRDWVLDMIDWVRH